jgi:hypothetical protein
MIKKQFLTLQGRRLHDLDLGSGDGPDQRCKISAQVRRTRRFRQHLGRDDLFPDLLSHLRRLDVDSLPAIPSRPKAPSSLSSPSTRVRPNQTQGCVHHHQRGQPASHQHRHGLWKVLEGQSVYSYHNISARISFTVK